MRLIRLVLAVGLVLLPLTAEVQQVQRRVVAALWAVPASVAAQFIASRALTGDRWSSRDRDETLRVEAV
jgi:hypothetical protein